MKKILSYCVGLMAVLSVASLSYAQETEPNKPSAGEIVQPPNLGDAQPSVSDQTAPPVPVAETPVAETPMNAAVVAGNDCVGCGQILPLLPNAYANPCGNVDACQPILVMATGGCQFQPCGFPVVQIAEFASSACGGYDTVSLVSYEEGVPTAAAPVAQEFDNVIVSPAAIDNSATIGIVSQAPVYQSSPMIDGAQTYNQAPAIDSNVSGVNSLQSGVSPMSGIPVVSSDAVGSGCVGCGSSTSGVMYSSSAMGQGGPAIVPRSMVRTRGFVGSRIFRRN